MMNSTLDSVPCGYLAFLDDGAVLQVNEALCRLLDYTKQEVEGKSVEALFTLSTRIFYQTHLFPLIKMQGYAEEIFLTLLTRSGNHLPVLLNLRRRGEDDRYVTHCAFMVVYNRKKFEDELVAARKEAERALRENTELLKVQFELERHTEQLNTQILVAQKQNYELRQLNRVVSHDLREPLRKVLVFADRLQLGWQQNEPHEQFLKYLDKLAKSAGQLQATVSGLQQYVWLNDQLAHFVSLDLNAVVAEAAYKLQQEVGDGVMVLRVQDLPVVEGDAGQLALLFYHLLANAVKFRKGAQAQVSITATLIQQNRFRALETRYKYEDYVKLEVRDEGIGFDPAFREEAFDLFKRMHHQEGRGLGLALCKKIAENHSGTISADSLVNGYTVIIVTLPLAQTH